jgi:hypothetical protein
MSNNGIDENDGVLDVQTFEKVLEEHMYYAMLAQKQQVESQQKSQWDTMAKLDGDINYFEHIVKAALHSEKHHEKQMKINRSLELKKMLKQRIRKLRQLKQKQREAARNTAKQLDTIGMLIDAAAKQKKP